MQFTLHWSDRWFPWFGFDRNSKNKRKKYKNTFAASWPFTGQLCQPNTAVLKSRKKLLNTDILSVLSTNCEIPTSLLCFKGGCCWFRCYFWQNDWLVGTSLSWTPETGNARGHSHVHIESVLLKTELALFGGWSSQALQPWEQQACCAPLILLHTTSSSIPSSLWPSAGSESVRQVDLSP